MSNNPLRRIDCHTHILPKSLIDTEYFKDYSTDEKYVVLKSCKDLQVDMYKGERFFRKVESNCFANPSRIEDMDKTNVTVQVISTVPVMFAYWKNRDDAVDMSRRINDDLMNIVDEEPTRYIALATLPLLHIEDAVQELERVMKHPGIAGIEIGTNIDERQLSDPSFLPLWAACERLGAAVFVHPWNMPRETGKYWLGWLCAMPYETSMAICSMIFSGVLDKYPNLRVMFAHGGGSFPGTIGRIEHGFDCRPDLVACDNPNNPREYCNRVWADCLTHDDAGLRNTIECFGKDKIVLGSDYPFPLGEANPGSHLEQYQDLSEDEKKRIMWDNAFEWLGMSDEKYLG